MIDMERDFPLEFFTRVDDTDDMEFYSFPRMVTHVDDSTIVALTAYLNEQLPPSPSVLDLMSSWVSHLPFREYESVVALGMNAEELAANVQATEWDVHDLNRTPQTPYENERFDWVLISFSVQYLTQPQAVFNDLARVIRPGGKLLIAISHRCFPTKAIQAFHVLSPTERLRFIALFIEAGGSYTTPTFIDRSPTDADPLWLIQASRL